ncbi:MAG: FesM [Planctomycetes bacterium]|nr:FesM [Planctomycetota bacterium]
MTSAAPARRRRSRGVLEWPLVGALLRWRHSRLLLQVPLFLVALVLVLHGLFGPRLAPMNLATVMVWVHYRGALVLVLLVAGNLFCMGCPMLALRDLARRFVHPRFDWPQALRNKWLSIGMLVGVLFGYELFDWWGDPRATAWLIVAYFGAILAVDLVFKHASFCKFVCPIGQFNFAASTISPLEIRAADARVCETCTTKDCIKGSELSRGCELALFVPEKRGNMDCTFCLDCVHACPHENVALARHEPADDLGLDPHRSGLGRFSKRPDLAALVTVFCFGALLNAFGMVSPVYAVQRWMAGVMHVESEWPVLTALFGVALVVEPLVLLGLACWATRAATGSHESLLTLGVRHAYCLAPLGFGIWIAHYSFHFLTGLLTFVPVLQKALCDLGAPILGQPIWRLGGLPKSAALPIELGLLSLGVIASCVVAWRIAERSASRRTLAAFLPWAALVLLLAGAAVWLFEQPMEMRGTFLQ